MAWRSNCTRSSSSRDFSTYTWLLLSKALFTSKEGFSVVAPISVIMPFSTAPSRASCWPLLKRWISSMKRIALSVSLWRYQYHFTHVFHAGADGAERKEGRCSVCAIILAIVVLPVPGGPHKIIEGTLPCSIAVRKMLPLPARCSCPTRSSSVSGRILSANGGNVFHADKVRKIKKRAI